MHPVASSLNYDLAVKSQDAVKLFSTLKSEGIDRATLSCNECRVSFLRGLFISCATVTDPENQYHLEFIFRRPESASAAYNFLADTFTAPKIINRINGVGLVYKSSSVIEDILSVIGANQAYFILINGKIEREIRNNENRATNCETRNIAASVDAAQKQISAIEKLKSEDKFDSLPQSLKETAEMRILYPSLPLSELAGKFAPPLTKSGLNNRLKKILELAN
jgi:DNA-binding protein WhiA